MIGNRRHELPGGIICLVLKAVNYYVLIWTSSRWMRFSGRASIPPASPQYLQSSFTMTPFCGLEILERRTVVTLNQHLLMSTPSTGELLMIGLVWDHSQLLFSKCIIFKLHITNASTISLFSPLSSPTINAFLLFQCLMLS